MKRLWLVLFALLSTPCAGFDRAVWQDDFAYLKKQLESRYANLAWFGSAQSGVDARALDRRATRALAAAADDADAKAAIADFINSFGDGHLSIMPALAPKDDIPAPPNRDLHGADAATACAALGYASTRSVPFSLPFESLADFSMVSDGVSKPFRTGIVAGPGLKIGLIRIKYFRQRDYPSVCENVWSKAAQEGKTDDLAAVRDRVDDAWYAALADQLKQLRGESGCADRRCRRQWRRQRRRRMDAAHVHRQTRALGAPAGHGDAVPARLSRRRDRWVARGLEGRWGSGQRARGESTC
jgi:hypothetical protein